MKSKTMIASALGSAALTMTLWSPEALAQSKQDLQIQINALQLQMESLERTMGKKKKGAEPGNTGLKIKWEPAPSLMSADGKYEMNLRGRIFTDAAWISDDDDTIDVKATEFRTVRLGIEGKADLDIKYKFEADFASDKVTVKDAYLQRKTGAGVAYTVGQFKTPNSLDEQTSSRHISLMERASFTDAFGLARRLGVGVSLGGDNWTAKAGAFRGSNSTKEQDEGQEFAGRVTWSPKVNEVQLHLGASARSRKSGDQSDYRYRQRPHQHQSPTRFVDTGSFANKDLFYGVEVGAVSGPWWAASEYAWLEAEASDPLDSDASFGGGYAEVGYFLTGEKRGYKPGKGAWDRPKVSTSVPDGGLGAWAISARYDILDLNDESYAGGEQATWIVGLTWYLNRYTRMMANYSQSDVSVAFDVAANGVDGENKINGFGLRAQIDW